MEPAACKGRRGGRAAAAVAKENIPGWQDDGHADVVVRMGRSELCNHLTRLSLDTSGTKEVLRQRLKSYCQLEHRRKGSEDRSACSERPAIVRSILHASKLEPCAFNYICVIDFEATCQEHNPRDFPHEIIEFPVVLLNTSTLQIEDTFQEYVKPFLNPTLSNFCTSLTGITQETVDAADYFPEVIDRVVNWMRQKGLGTTYTYAILTDGSWDMARFLNIQCQLSQLPYPRFAKKWINVRKTFCYFFKLSREKTKLSHMLECLELQPEGRAHSGLDDSRNIARVAGSLLSRGCCLRLNERLSQGRVTAVRGGETLAATPVPSTPRHKHSRNSQSPSRLRI
ncbi:3'-5' exoribonuclease 1 isoform X2 [Petromyzon marinus]|uniref:3'-5' exoribonuclease 1 isoform X2 n=1 Tax=Petromyzon marinus TaxID=7757 RepID=A0AAJ7WR27_PETMA|nr:3'-5' exoribonuclease 1 isoform X2 [Petromyzon marinus]